LAACDFGNAIAEVEAHLRAEQAQAPGTGVVLLAESLVPNAGEQVEILAQCGSFPL
jgi:hypothetical protein